MGLATHIATIQLAGGEHVAVFDFYVRSTYGLLWAGTPDRQLNETMLGQLATVAQDWWQDEHEALVLRPSNGALETQLPAYLMMAMLDCSTPLVPEYHGSMLRVVWFSDTLPNNLSEFLQQSLEHVDWRKKARDYYI